MGAQGETAQPEKVPQIIGSKRAAGRKAGPRAQQRRVAATGTLGLVLNPDPDLCPGPGINFGSISGLGYQAGSALDSFDPETLVPDWVLPSIMKLDPLYHILLAAQIAAKGGASPRSSDSGRCEMIMRNDISTDSGNNQAEASLPMITSATGRYKYPRSLFGTSLSRTQAEEDGNNDLIVEIDHHPKNSLRALDGTILDMYASPDCSSMYGCYGGYCRAGCGYSQNSWCYTTRSYSQSYSFVTCTHDSQCDGCWKCASICGA
ncbi:Allergen Tha p 2 [Eumeta japonica]|uniref:Allergen Tha p 2 n=1 Tax=Eumeta variegata TaxID=151549 RepID=A0A4C1VS22_EUMVA|nr:Allergen Tha p 2 [Eumeta japonica]